MNDLKEYINLDGYTKKDNQIIWLFELLEESDQTFLANFLFYFTACFKTPYGGFKNFKVTIQKGIFFVNIDLYINCI